MGTAEPGAEPGAEPRGSVGVAAVGLRGYTDPRECGRGRGGPRRDPRWRRRGREPP